VTAADARVVQVFRQQVGACREAGSEFTARLFERCADDVEAGGPVARLVADFEGNPLLDALPQRVLGAVQALVLAGEAPELAALHPATGGTPRFPEAADAFLATVERHLARLRPELAHQVQTNEVRRAAGLLGGFLVVADETGLPLRVLEIGSSAGLLLFFDRYRYELGPYRWGDPAAALCLRSDWKGPPPPLDAPLRVASRQGCDLHPIDARDPAQLRRIQSYYWADQLDRQRLLLAAAAALPGPAPVERVRAGDFVARELAGRREGVATVLFHSSMWWYVPRAEQRAIRDAVQRAGECADGRAPVAWLRAEPPDLHCAELRLSVWPGGEDRLLARVAHHGQWVEWQAGEGVDGPQG
jgi:hypothetical protein